MINLIKAQQYRTRRDYTTYIIIFVGMVIYTFFMLVTISDSSEGASDASHYFFTSATSQAVVGNLLIMTLTTLISGSDMLDRTMNFELLDGSKRSRVYFSRFIVSLCWALGVVYAMVLIPIMFMGVFKGWGNLISVADFAKRMVLLLFPYVRMIALYTSLTFIIGDYRAVFAIGFILCQFELLAEMIIQELTKLPTYVRAFFSVSAVNVLMDVDNLGFDYVDAKDITVIKDTLTTSDKILCAGICAAMTVIILVIGLKVFKKKDLK